MQVAIKKCQATRDDKLDAFYLQVSNDSAVKGLAEDEKKLVEAKEKKIQIAKEQFKQHQEKLDVEKKERLVNLFLNSVA